ncbi:MAG: hypothetical protein ACYCYO_22060 [Bacilli bacterium]
MPRAENRKRPPNVQGNTVNGSRNKVLEAQKVAETQGAQNRKQELIEKMKKIQESKKTGGNPNS